MTGPMVQGGLRDGHMTIPLLLRHLARIYSASGSGENVAVRYNNPQQCGTFRLFRMPLDRTCKIWPG